MRNSEFEKYLDKIRKYTEDVFNSKISPEKSLNSLVKAGICNEKKEIKTPYVLEKSAPLQPTPKIS